METEIELELQPRQMIAAKYWNDNITEQLLFGGA